MFIQTILYPLPSACQNRPRHAGRSGAPVRDETTRWIAPAFGAYAGGLDVHEDAIRGLFPGGFDVWLLGRDHVRRGERERLSAPRRLARATGPSMANEEAP